MTGASPSGGKGGAGGIPLACAGGFGASPQETCQRIPTKENGPPAGIKDLRPYL